MQTIAGKERRSVPENVKIVDKGNAHGETILFEPNMKLACAAEFDVTKSRGRHGTRDDTLFPSGQDGID